MAQTGYTPIQLYYSNTTGTTPASLANGELAINQYDGKLFYRNNSGVVTQFNPAVTAVTTISFGSIGLTPSTATSGVVTVAGTLVSANGGTGFSTYATGDIIYASASNTLSKLTAGTNGYVLTLAAGVPTWAASTGGVTSFSAGTTGLTPSSATTGAITLAGTLDADNGGTGQSSYTVGDILYASTTTALSKLAAGTSTYVLTSNGPGTAPSWQVGGGGGVTSISFGSTGLTPSTTTTGAVTVAGTLGSGYGGTGFSTYATGDIIYASASNTLSKLTAGTNGYVLRLTAGVPTWSADVTSFSGGTTGLTPNTATTGAITLAGTLGATSGGTSQSTYTTGDILYASASNTLSKLAAGTNGYVLTLAAGVPSWAAATGSVPTNALLTGVQEATNPSTAAITGTLNLDVKTASFWRFTTTSTTVNWTMNIRGDSSTTLNSIMALNSSITISYSVLNGTTGNYQNVFQIDGVAQTPFWVNGVAPTNGNTNSTDIYTMTIVKTAATPTYAVYGALVRYA